MLGFNFISEFPISAIYQVRVLWESDIITPDAWTPASALSSDWNPISPASAVWTAPTPTISVWSDYAVTPATWTED